MHSALPSVSCPICGHASYWLAALDLNKSCMEEVGLFLERSGVKIDYLLCEECGFCFAPEMMAWPADRFAKSIYNRDYALFDPDFVFSRPYANARMLQRMFGAYASSLRHLDYGGGEGELCDFLGRVGWQSISYDPYALLSSPFTALSQYDLITAFEVFEHTTNPLQLMELLQSLLVPGGIILFSTLLSDGNIQEAKLDWWYAAPRNGHISLFSERSLVTLGGQRGFRFISLNRNYHVLFNCPPAWASQIFRG